MASLAQMKLYATIEEGKRVVIVHPAALPALRMWLWRKGFRWQSNKIGKKYEVTIHDGN